MPEFSVTTKAAVGWYGKVPCVGDFVRSGLSPGFVQSWDHWLQGLMITGRETLQNQWQACYMSAPIWRFALPAGICGSHSVAGLVMPSVDRVGRQFPLCLAEEADDPAGDLYKRLLPAMPMLEDVALAMLEETAKLDLLQQIPQRLPSEESAFSIPEPSLQKSRLPCHFTGSEEEALAAMAQHDQATLWISSVDEDNRILLTPQMPSGSEMAHAIFDLNAPIWNKRA
ncbi:type VI secretion system protein ImpM [Cohaesibacter marisflavi]|uniref:Type VI secretion system protein ImpM n=1 Tax=Cohaesibacter marisflavi TaxID=655353 RepID=A0A1I5KJC7_9HYPH|nr:type VI secretion system-associated protein TagF [Cohaesibacter marisflavi]SFO84987.1 type VI secretion system protein ImpM [Cohaesibacter marisflavi]